MLQFNTKFLILTLLLIVPCLISGQVEIEHFSSTINPTLKLVETGQNNFTRLFFTNSNTNKEWNLASRFFSGGSQLNSLDFNYYNGTTTTTFLDFTSTPATNGLETVNIRKDATFSDRVYIGVAANNFAGTALDVFTETEFYGAIIENETASAGTIYGSLVQSKGSGTGDRIGISGNAISQSGEARGIYGTASSSTGLEYGVYGEASGAGGSSWGVYSNGDFWFTGALMAPSDERIKKNIKKIKSNVLENLMLLEVKTYEYDQTIHPSMKFAKGPQIGFLAQDLQVLFPETVSERRHSVREIPGDVNSKVSTIEILGVDYIKIIPILTSAIQEQNHLIEAVQAENKLLKDELAEIKNMIAELQK